VWKTREELHTSSSGKKQKRDADASTQKIWPKVGYSTETDMNFDDTKRHTERKTWTKSHHDRGDESKAPEWMPKRDEKQKEIKQEDSHRSSSFKQEQGKRDRNKRSSDQYPKKDWKKRSDGHSYRDKKRKREYARGDNPSRRIRPPL
jgi:hypothetical protein